MNGERNAGERGRINPFRLLRDLGDVVETRDIEIATGHDRKTATETLSRWAKAGYVKPFASGVFFNLVRNPSSPQTHVFEAATRTVRRPMLLIGASALAAAGWTTQMPAGYELAIPTDRNIRGWKRMEGISAEARPVGWFASVVPHAIGGGLRDFDRLPPALALVDAIASAERFSELGREERKARLRNATVTWHPDPDDICVPGDMEPHDMWKALEEAAEILDYPLDKVRRYAAGIPDLADSVNGRDGKRPAPAP